LAYEDLCFHAQQAAEKALKWFLIYLNIIPPKSHNLQLIITEISKHVKIDEKLFQTIDLKNYSVDFRYPGEYIPVTEQ
jgi:HEPN domain-containing protein